MPLGRAPKRMLGSAARSEWTCGHSPVASGADGALDSAARCVEVASPGVRAAADDVRANVARAASAARSNLFMESLEVPPEGRRKMPGFHGWFKAGEGA